MTEDYKIYPLKVFRVVARLGSVTRAAQELCIRKPAGELHRREMEKR